MPIRTNPADYGGTTSPVPTQDPQAIREEQASHQEELLQAFEEAKQADKFWWSAEGKEIVFKTAGTGDRGKNFDAGTSKPKDSSSQLTFRLVSANGQFTVRQVIAQAGSDLAQLRMIAAAGNKEDAAKAEACIRKLEKLVVRAGKKIRELNDEDLMKIRQTRAERKKLDKRADEIKAELKKRRAFRMTRENGYLLERLSEDILGGDDGWERRERDRVDAAIERQIERQAEAMAVAETVAAEPSGVELPAGDTAAPVESDGAVESTGESEL